MTKTDLVARIAEEAGISKKAAGSALDSVVEAIHDALKKRDKIRIADLGSFGVVNRQARKGVNPRTGDPIEIPAGTVPRFSPSKALREAIKK